MAEWQPLDNSCGSDHLPVITSIHAEYSSSVTIPQPKWKLSKAHWDRFKNLCSDTLKTVESGSMDEVSEGFTDLLKDICDKTFPKTKPKPRKTRPPWWDNELTEAVREREQARKKYLKKKEQNH